MSASSSARPPGLGHVPRGQQDLDDGGQHLAPGEGVRRAVEHAANGGGRVLGAALLDAQQRQPGLRLPPVLVGAPVRRLGLVEPPEETQGLGLLVQRPAELGLRAGR